MISQNDREFIESFIQETKKKSSFLMNSWMLWIVLILGWVLTIYTLGTVRANINETTFKFVFLPGVGFGLVLMVFWGIGMKMVQRIRKEKKLGEIVLKMLNSENA